MTYYQLRQPFVRQAAEFLHRAGIKYSVLRISKIINAPIAHVAIIIVIFTFLFTVHD